MPHVDVSQLLIDAYGDSIHDVTNCPIFHALENAGFTVIGVYFEAFEIFVNGQYQSVMWPVLSENGHNPVFNWQVHGPGRPFSFDVDTDTWTVRNLTLNW